MDRPVTATTKPVRRPAGSSSSVSIPLSRGVSLLSRARSRRVAGSCEPRLSLSICCNSTAPFSAFWPYEIYNMTFRERLADRQRLWERASSRDGAAAIFVREGAVRPSAVDRWRAGLLLVRSFCTGGASPSGCRERSRGALVAVPDRGGERSGTRPRGSRGCRPAATGRRPGRSQSGTPDSRRAPGRAARRRRHRSSPRSAGDRTASPGSVVRPPRAAPARPAFSRPSGPRSLRASAGGGGPLSAQPRVRR
jgi:hypothetical protein